jgi:hypothetical protein
MNKMDSVNISKPEQFLHENKTWLRLLEFFKQENIFLKNRLAEVVDQKADKEFLALAERFQNKFIVKDEFIDELRHDVNAQSRALLNNDWKETYPLAIKKQARLRNEMDYL